MKMENKFQRQTAIKTNIKNIILGKYVQTSEQEANYLLGANQQKLYRINLIAIIVQKEQTTSITNLMLDDGSGKISIRSFEKNKNVDQSNIGNVILVVGKARSYNDEIYISPEIVKKIDPLWLKIRSHLLNKELNLSKLKENEKIEDEIIVGLNNDINQTGKLKIDNKKEDEYLNEIKELTEIDEVNENLTKKNQFEEKELEKIDLKKEKEISENHLLPVQKIIEIINKLDSGNGVMIEEIIENSTLDNSEKIIEKMLEAGDIFQIQPGKVKIL